MANQQFDTAQLQYLAGRLARIARKSFCEDHRCSCGHSVNRHLGGKGKCWDPKCTCRNVVTGIDICDCPICIAKDAFEQVVHLSVGQLLKGVI
jgi:hypothetical protein